MFKTIKFWARGGAEHERRENMQSLATKIPKTILLSLKDQDEILQKSFHTIHLTTKIQKHT